MTKLKAFITALIMLFLFMAGVHVFCLNASLKDKPSMVGAWASSYKDLSYTWSSTNLKGTNNMPVLGSSEFYHGRGEPYHPFALLKKNKIKIMNVGGPFNQTLFHTVFLGSVEKNMKNRKVVLLASPTWFKDDGVTKESYSLRFSLSEYIAFMENKDIPSDIKNYVAKRSEMLLSGSDSLQRKVKLVDKVNLKGKKKVTLLDKINYTVMKNYTYDTDVITTRTAMIIRSNHLKTVHSNLDKPLNGDINWSALVHYANSEGAKYSKNNKFYMQDSQWKKMYKANFKRLKNYNKNTVWSDSPEFDDLKTFLQLCEQSNIEAKVIVLPVNGYWYDYTGMTKKKRDAFDRKIEQVCNDNGAEMVSLSKYNYDKYVMMDAVHPWGKGWILINEQICNFYKEK